MACMAIPVLPGGPKTEYLIKVDVLAVEGLSWHNPADHAEHELPNPYVQVSVGNDEKDVKVTPAREDCFTCVFNYFLIWNMHLTKDEFQAGSVNVIVYHEVKGILSSGQEFLAQTSFGLPHVYAERGHIINPQWFPLVNPADPASQRGHIRLSLGVYGPGDEVGSVKETMRMGNDDGSVTRSLAARVVSAPSVSKRPLLLCLRVSRGDGLKQVYERTQLWSATGTANMSSFVRVRFMGLTDLCTKVQEYTDHPIWNQNIQIPFLDPCLESTISIELWHTERGKGDTVTSISALSDHLVGSCLIDFATWRRENLGPVWCNYYRGTSQSGLITAKRTYEASEFVGKVLISGSVDTKLNPRVLIEDVSASDMSGRETQDEFVVWVDLWQAVIEENPQAVRIRLELGSASAMSGEAFRVTTGWTDSGPFQWNDEAGQVEEARVRMVAANSPDMILTMFGATGWMSSAEAAMMYVRIPSTSFINAGRGRRWVMKPEWYEMKRVGEEEHVGSAVVGRLLAAIAVGPVGDSDRPCPRPVRRDYISTRGENKYSFRAMIYQATNIPTMDSQGLCDPFVKISFAGGMVTSQVVPKTLQPVWNEGLECCVELPEDRSSWPEVTVELLDSDFTKSDLIATMREKSGGMVRRREDMRQPPVWYDLNPGEHALWARSELLAAFEIVPRKFRAAWPLEPNLQVPTVGCRLRLFIIGVRLIDEVAITPCIRVAYGRRAGNLAHACGEKQTEIGQGEGRNFNFLETVVFDNSEDGEINEALHLPETPHFQNYLEVTLLDSGATLTSGIYGYSYIHLNSYMPESWIPLDKKKEMRARFLPQHRADLEDQYAERLKEEVQVEALHTEEEGKGHQSGRKDHKKRFFTSMFSEPSTLFAGPSHTKSSADGDDESDGDDCELDDDDGDVTDAAARGQDHIMKQLNGLEDDLGDYFRLDIGEGTNTRMYERLDYVNDAQPGEDQFSSPGASFDHSDTSHSSSDHSESDHSEELVLSSNVSSETEHVSESEDASSSNASSSTSSGQLNIVHQQFVDEFTWANRTRKYKKKGTIAARRRNELGRSLNDVLKPEDLPYSSTPIYLADMWGDTCTIGTLKFRCLVMPLEEESEKECYDRMWFYHEEQWLQETERVVRMFEEARELVVRLYTLNAYSLLPKSGKGLCDTYLWICGGSTASGGVDKGPHNFVDPLADYIWDDVSPEYNRCYTLVGAQMSMNPTLAVTVMEYTPRQERIEIGRYLIDLEDRWFHPDYSKLKSKHIANVETVTMRTAGSLLSKGTMRLYVDVLKKQEAETWEPDRFEGGGQRTFQVQIVIWRSRNVPPIEGETTNQLVSAQMQKDDGTPLEQTTDIHYGSNDKCATWNWRMLFPILVPCHNASVELSLIDKSRWAAAYDAPIGDVVLDLMPDVMEAKRTKLSVEHRRCWLRVLHSAHRGETRGELEVELRLVPEAEAKLFPVGEGWEEPNEDPFCDQNDPHLVAHRGSLASSIAAGAVDMANYAAKGIGWMLFVKLAIWAFFALSGLVSFALMAKFMGNSNG